MRQQRVMMACELWCQSAQFKLSFAASHLCNLGQLT